MLRLKTFKYGNLAVSRDPLLGLEYVAGAPTHCFMEKLSV